jgi:hypothetical protein
MQIGPPTVSPVVNDATACFKCGYALRGLAMNGVCPECGSPVQESLRGILLQYAAPEYIQTLLKGHSWVLNGILLSIVAGLVAAIAGGVAGALGTALGPVMMITAGLSLAVSVLIFMGYIKLTEPDPKFTGTENPKGPRTWVRLAAIGSIAFAALGVVAQIVTVTNALAGASGVLTIIASFGGFVAYAVQFFAMMLYMKWLGARVPDAWIAKRTGIYIWLLPVLSTAGACLLVGPLVAFVLYWNLLDRMRKHLKSIVANGVPATLKGRESLG